MTPNKSNIRKNKSTKLRPKNLNLLTIRLPINALVSILHRATGFVLFLVLPFLLLLIQISVTSDAHFKQVVTVMDTMGMKIILTGLAWAFFHHFFAGLRHLAMDVHWMTSLMKARLTSKLVLVLGIVATFLFAISVWR